MHTFANPVEVDFVCTICHETVTVTVEAEDLERWKRRETNIQDIFPYLSAGERELFLSGICPECYDNLFSASFSAEDDERDELLVRIQDYLKGRTEEDPVLTDDLELTLGKAEACGLSSLELPEVRSLFLDEFGDPCYTVHGSEETYPVDDMSLTDLRNAEECLRKRFTLKTTQNDA